MENVCFPQDPPGSPTVRVTFSNHTSIGLSWKQTDTENTVQGKERLMYTLQQGNIRLSIPCRIIKQKSVAVVKKRKRKFF